MNIYIHLEVSVRELDSKLLQGVIAASRGHEVIISDEESIVKGLERKFLKPGIFHTKSLTFRTIANAAVLLSVLVLWTLQELHL